MPYTKLDLQNLYNLCVDEVNQTLTAAGLAEHKEPYTDEQIQSSFDVIRSYFNSQQVSDYTAAADLFKQHQPNQHLEIEPQTKTKKPGREKKSESSNGNGVDQSERLNILELIALACEQVGTRLALTEAVQILAACGLPDKDLYVPQECERFLEACDLLKKQNKSYEQVAAHFGKTDPQVDLKADMQEILGMVGSAALATEDDLLRVLKELTAKRGHAISAMYERMLLTQVAQHLRERQQKRQLFTQFGEQLEAYVEGKSSIPSLEILPAFSQEPTLKSLPKSSDNS
jgi:hypothetical protein